MSMTLEERCAYYNNCLLSKNGRELQDYLDRHETTIMFKLVFSISENYINYDRNIIGDEIYPRLTIADSYKDLFFEYDAPEISKNFHAMIKKYTDIIDRQIKLMKI